MNTDYLFSMTEEDAEREQKMIYRFSHNCFEKSKWHLTIFFLHKIQSVSHNCFEKSKWHLTIIFLHKIQSGRKTMLGG